MPGFLVTNQPGGELRNMREDACTRGELALATGLIFKRNTLNRFMDDKCFESHGGYTVATEGVLLNRAELLTIYKQPNIYGLVTHLYQQKGECFFECFRGSFSGALYDETKDKLVVFTNHVGDSTIFYWHNDTSFAFGSQANYVLSVLKAADVSITLDMSAVYAMLSYGFMIDDATYAREVKRLLPGHYAVVENGAIRIEEYWRIKRNQLEIPTDRVELIDALDERFRTAVRREFEKDVEYGYHHVADLSGGLDSRMTTWVAHDMGYTEQLNLTYCQSGYIDERVAEQISERLRHELLFKPLDDVGFIFDTGRLIGMNFGLSLYSGITGGESLLRCLDWSRFGVEHTGQLGDVIIGSYLNQGTDASFIHYAGYYSDRFIRKMPDPAKGDWADQEQYMLATRGLLGMLSTHMIRRNYTEIAAPFIDVDFLDFTLSIPTDYRAGHTLYHDWILSKYPGAGNFVWEKSGSTLGASALSKFSHRVVRGVGRRTSRYLGLTTKGASMNPFDYWEVSRPDVLEFLDGKIAAGGGCLGEYKQSLLDGYQDASLSEKVQLVTALLAADYFMNYGDIWPSSL